MCTMVLVETLQIIAEHLPIANMEPVGNSVRLPLVPAATPDVCYCPMVSSDSLQCLTKLLPESVGPEKSPLRHSLLLL